jgi:hypothetical protein
MVKIQMERKTEKNLIDFLEFLMLTSKKIKKENYTERFH